MPGSDLLSDRETLGLAELPGSIGPLLDRVEERAKAVDREGADPWTSLEELGGLGLLDGDLAVSVEIIHALARRCTATAFSLWGHRSALEYHRATGAPFPDGAATGRLALASGMAPAFKEEAGLGEIPLLATTTTEGDLEVAGTLPWCSNLRPGALIVTPVRFEDGSRAVIRLPRDGDGVQVKPLTGLTALDATSSGVLLVQRSRIPSADILSRDLPAFRDRVRTTFLSLQSAMCLGLAEAAADAADVVADAVCRRTFASEFSEIADRRAALGEAIRRTVAQGSAAAPLELVRIRLETALLAGSATALEQKVTGGKGYALGSPTSRRAREAAFLPVQSPTETHLRHLLDSAGLRAGG